MLDIRKNSNTACTALAISVLFEQSFFGAQLVEVTDSAVLGGVAEVVSSNPTMSHKIFFSIYRHR